MKLIVVASLAALALGAMMSADAQSVSEVVVTGRQAPAGSAVRSKTVNCADLDLSKSAGLSALLDRIRAAANDVCSPEPEAKDAKDSADFRRCIAHAVDSAVRSVDNPTLTAMLSHAAR